MCKFELWAVGFGLSVWLYQHFLVTQKKATSCAMQLVAFLCN
jgi:hypothetical protein